MRAPASIVLSDIMVSNLGQNDLDDAEDFNISIVDLKVCVCNASTTIYVWKYILLLCIKLHDYPYTLLFCVLYCADG